MTGPALRFDPRWQEGGAAADAKLLLPLTGRFRDPRLEAEFRIHVWPEWSSRLRVVSLLASLLILALGYTDYLALGWGAPLYVCWGLRLSVFFGALAVTGVTRGRARVELLDNTIFALMLLFSSALFVVVGLQNKGVMFETPGVVLMILGFYLFVPARFEVQLASAVFVSLGFVVVATMLLAPTPPELITAALEIVICNVLGAFTALRTHRLHRREFIGLRQVEHKARFEELIARLSTRFITLPPEETDAGIAAALGDVALFAGVDRAHVFEFDDQLRETSCVQEWCRSGVAPAMKSLQRVPFAAFSWAMREIQAGRTIAARSLAELPDEAVTERSESARQGVQSMLVLPLVLGARVVGAIGFHTVETETTWSDDRIAILRMAGEMIIGLIVRQRTRGELLQQTRTLEKSVVALEKSNSALQQFAYVASHDLQEPLRSISSFASLLSERYRGRMDAKADEYIGYLTSAAARMHALITSLLDYSRLESRARPFTRCSTRDAAGRAVENLHASIEESRAEVVIGALPQVDGDPSQLVQLFQNLIGNALKFHDGRPPRVTVGAQRFGNHWRFEVNDNGIGIDPRHAERIFAIFTRLHGREQYPGTGIGLAVCKRIVERHHGRIWVERNLPQGSSFRFTLPVAA